MKQVRFHADVARRPGYWLPRPSHADAATDAAACPDARPGCYWAQCFDPSVPTLLCVDGTWVCEQGTTDPSGCPCPVMGPDPPPVCYACDGGSVGQLSCNRATREWECPDGGYFPRNPPQCAADAGAD